MSNIHKFERICKQLATIYMNKNKDYGNSFSHQFHEYGLISSLIRIEDKLQRLKSLVRKANINNEALDIPIAEIEKHIKVTDEKIEDTIRDLVNYGIMTLMELENRD